MGNRGRTRFAGKRKCKAVPGSRQQLCLGKNRAECRKQAAAQNGCRQPFDQRQADRITKPEKIPVVPQQLVGLQQAHHIRIFYNVPMTCGRDCSTNAVHCQGQGQGTDPPGGSAFGDKGSQHNPQPHHKRTGPLCK